MVYRHVIEMHSGAFGVISRARAWSTAILWIRETVRLSARSRAHPFFGDDARVFLLCSHHAAHPDLSYRRLSGCAAVDW